MVSYGRNFRYAGHMWPTCPGLLPSNAVAGSKIHDLLITTLAPKPLCYCVPKVTDQLHQWIWQQPRLTS